MMDAYDLLNAAFGVIMTMFGFLLRVVWDAVERLKTDLNALEVKLPEAYVQKVDMKQQKEDIEKRFDKLDVALKDILDKLNWKVDKHDRRSTDHE